MNHLPFIIAAYAVSLGAIVVMLIWSFGRMRRAERSIDRRSERT